jgi:ApbE superfamily uncharacterized protein (UPF0280 family)
MSRPAKRIVLYCAEEARASRMAFVLRVRGFAAAVCDSEVLLAHEIDFGLPDAVLVLEHDNAVRQRVGKKAAGHLLDGAEWHQFPEPRA